jgi:hypothetical protein
VWVVALSLRAISASPYQVSSFRLGGCPQKYQVRSGAIFTNVSLMSRPDSRAADAASHFPFTHDFDRQTQARFLRALRKSYLKADWNNIDLATVQLSRPCSFWQLQASFWVIGMQVLVVRLGKSAPPYRSPVTLTTIASKPILLTPLR